MKFKTKQEKRAFRMGCACGKKRAQSKANVRAYDSGAKTILHVQTLKDKPKRDLDFSGYFDFDERGRIKGSYTCDGFFEPD